MNSYNENLQTSVLNSLQALELEEKNMKSKLDASIFTLFYAEGAQITATNKLAGANGTYLEKQNVLNQAVNNHDISTNLLASANEQKKYISQAVTNSAVAAANVQVAANAVLRLASDVGSIFSIVSAADMDTEIYTQSKETYDLMNDTAYEAELTSQIAMEASSMMAAVSSGTVADMAKSTDTSVSDIFKIATTEFQAAAATVAASNDALSAASAAEKVAEGVLEYTNVEYFATRKAYQLNNMELNLNLHVPAKTRTDVSYVVNFDCYRSPFEKESDKPGYPVKNYHIMLVKNSSKSVFSITNAEAVLAFPGRFVTVAPPHDKTKRVIDQKIFTSELQDVDGDNMQLGREYTVFVLVTLMDEYKKAINNFDDYLTAPSSPFAITNHLVAPAAGKDNVVVVEEGGHQVLKFTLEENKTYKVEYRCMFLPTKFPLDSRMLTEAGLRTIEKEVEKMEEIADKFDPPIAAKRAQLNTLLAQQQSLDKLIETLKKEIQHAPEKQKQKLQAELKEARAKYTGNTVELGVLQQELKTLEDERRKAVHAINVQYKTQLEFFFNKKIAEQITAGNYLVAKTEMDKNPIKPSSDIHKVKGTAELKPEATDVFGNRLYQGKVYIPVVLAQSSALEENQDQFSNALSNYDKATPFTYTASPK